MARRGPATLGLDGLSPTLVRPARAMPWAEHGGTASGTCVAQATDLPDARGEPWLASGTLVAGGTDLPDAGGKSWGWAAYPEAHVPGAR